MGKNNDLKKQRKLLEEQKNSLLQSIKKINNEIDFLNKKYDEIELIKNTLLENPSLENNHIAIKQMEEEQAKITTQIENKAIEIKKLDETNAELTSQIIMLNQQIIKNLEKAMGIFSFIPALLFKTEIPCSPPPQKTTQNSSSNQLNKILLSLEDTRKLYIRKQLFLIIAAFVILFIGFIIEIKTGILTPPYIFKGPIFITFIPTILLLAFAQMVNKEFETTAKQKLLSSFGFNSEILNNITGDLGKIKWNTDIYQNEDNSPETLFNKYMIEDDNFSGIYNNVKFSATEYDATEGKAKIFKGIIIKIACNINYSNKLVIKKTHFWENPLFQHTLVKGLKKIPKMKIFADNSFKIYTDNPLYIEELLTPNFINLVNSLGTKYLFAFAEKNLYIITETKKDKFNMGSLYQKIDDSKQFQLFANDIKEILNIITLTKDIEYLEKPTEKDWLLINT